MLESILSQVIKEAGVGVTPLPEGVRVSRQGDTEIWMNFNQAPVTLPDGSTIGPVSFQLHG